MSCISEVDIEAWREDEKQTDFLEMRREADNHVGWAVEWLSPAGWVRVSQILPTWLEAHLDCQDLRVTTSADEFRVYEVVK